MKPSRNSTLLLSIASLLLTSTGCEKKQEETFKTVEYYVQNKQARESRKNECMQMKNTTQSISRDCQNVNIAINQTMESGGSPDTTGFFK